MRQRGSSGTQKTYIPGCLTLIYQISKSQVSGILCGRSRKMLSSRNVAFWIWGGFFRTSLDVDYVARLREWVWEMGVQVRVMGERAKPSFGRFQHQVRSSSLYSSRLLLLCFSIHLQLHLLFPWDLNIYLFLFFWKMEHCTPLLEPSPQARGSFVLWNLDSIY